MGRKLLAAIELPNEPTPIKQPKPRPFAVPHSMSVMDAGPYIGLGERSVRALMASGVLPYHRLGGRCLIRTQDLQDLIDGLPVGKGDDVLMEAS
jgi:excisionase family DNA binding protein